MRTQLNSLNDIVGTDLLNGSVFHVIVWEHVPGVAAYELIGKEGLAWDSYYYGYLHNPERLHPAVALEWARIPCPCRNTFYVH